jgi:hypothetical protein
METSGEGSNSKPSQKTCQLQLKTFMLSEEKQRTDKAAVISLYFYFSIAVTKKI